MDFYITKIEPFAPPYRLSQEECLEWLSRAYGITQKMPSDHAKKILGKFMAKPNQVFERWHFLEDFSHHRWDAMEIFRLGEGETTKDIGARNLYHERIATQVFREMYAQEEVAPSDLIHVTCTGYASPSPAHRLVSGKNWGRQTKITQLYHMGCFAAIPALRLAAQNARSTRTDIVHTELCSLHFDPFEFTPEQMVIHGLFADGVVRCSVQPGDQTERALFSIEGTMEEILPSTQNDMTWRITAQGFRMTLAKAVPQYIEKNIQDFVERMAQTNDFSKVVFALHPGGPKIIDTIAQALALRPDQIIHSREILKHHGNMSSATLPHIWSAIAKDAGVGVGTKVVSLAFGPGLSLCGALLRKVGHAG